MDEDIDLPQPPLRFPSEPLCSLRRANVGDDEVFAILAVSGAREHPGATGAKTLDRRQADSFCAAGHDGAKTSELFFVVCCVCYLC
jgi:hypothetical protein